MPSASPVVPKRAGDISAPTSAETGRAFVSKLHCVSAASGVAGNFPLPSFGSPVLVSDSRPAAFLSAVSIGSTDAGGMTSRCSGVASWRGDRSTWFLPPFTSVADSSPPDEERTAPLSGVVGSPDSSERIEESSDEPVSDICSETAACPCRAISPIEASPEGGRCGTSSPRDLSGCSASCLRPPWSPSVVWTHSVGAAPRLRPEGRFLWQPCAPMDRVCFSTGPRLLTCGGVTWPD